MELESLRAALLGASAVVPHTDADGLAAGALALRARGEGSDAAMLLGRGETPFAVAIPAGAAVLDWGVRPVRAPALIVDHHAPEWEPPPGVPLLSGYGEEPETATAPLVRRLVPEQPAWLAAVGAVGDLGDAGFALPEAAPASRSAVRKLVALVNAPRRLRNGPVRTALRLLVEHETPQAALADPRTRELEEAKRAWQSAYRAALKVAPRVTDRVAVVRLSTPYQVHPLVAAAWRRRLAPRVVLVANDEYLPGRVNFAVRGGGGDLRRLLLEALPEAGGEFAHGHDRATGGSLAPEQFELLLERLGAAV